MMAIVIIIIQISVIEACSSRSTPKPRPPSPTPRPNITFHTYACPPTYATWYCLNGATCFTVKIGESLLYNCECADGYMGQRCEFKDLDGSYLPSRKQVMLETASIASGASIAVFLVVIVCFSLYVHCQRKKKLASALAAECCTDGPGGSGLERRRMPFDRRPSPNTLPEQDECVLTRITTEEPRAADTRTPITGKGDSVSASQLYHQSSPPPLPHHPHTLPSCTPSLPAPSQPPSDTKQELCSSTPLSATLIV
uniref:Protein spitz n=1 Tax=Cacopsylla melanoneura TaxID=428564 RepID=A0A8D8YU10_9HEMI